MQFVNLNDYFIIFHNIFDAWSQNSKPDSYTNYGNTTKKLWRVFPTKFQMCKGECSNCIEVLPNITKEPITLNCDGLKWPIAIVMIATVTAGVHHTKM